MKKTLIFIVVILSALLCCTCFQSCSDEEDGIIGTSWKEKETGFNLVIDFIDEDDAKISSGLLSNKGKYTYDESTQEGTFYNADKNSPFYINGKILTFEKTKFYKQ